MAKMPAITKTRTIGGLQAPRQGTNDKIMADAKGQPSFKFDQVLAMTRQTAMRDWMGCIPKEEMRADHVEGYCVTKALVLYSPVLHLKDSTVEPLNTAPPADLYKIIGNKLPNNLYALIASGLSSSSVGTYAGQIVMAGFMNWRIPLFVRRALTMLPALIVLGLAVNTTQALIYSQIVLSFGIPFALIPLLLITRTRQTMTDMVNRRLTTISMLLITVIITTLNLYLLYDTLASLI